MFREVEPRAWGRGLPPVHRSTGPEHHPAPSTYIHILPLLGGLSCRGCQGARGLQRSPALDGAASLAMACTFLQTAGVGRVLRPSAEAACSKA